MLPQSYKINPTQQTTSVIIQLRARQLSWWRRIWGFQGLDSMLDGQGRFLYVKGTITGMLYTFANIYLPNKRQAQFLRKALNKLSDFSEGTLVLGGDFNTPLDPIMDSSTRHSSIPQLHIRSMKRALGDMELVDCWRTLHPTTRDFTYYSALHDRYSQIDYIGCYQPGWTPQHGQITAR
ncbi:Hypothetical predicted protein [Pelobates cultripes]|uniref:Endonuclease/exonuclease/phosphatase domain-containing protein n=1 Tax=Pelobates cultripes TaxID=61616 RepID=A0AAD1T9D8_PELCU|nr:Hypothetical predicted protein [Pelobates cultripes]